MTKQELFENIQRKKSFLCVGLDTDVNKIPEHLFDESDDPIFAFNKAIIDATADLCVAYKPNLAFYESLGLEGWEILERTVEYIRESYPDQFIIADAKRGDIGNTSEMYARSFFDELNIDSVTVAPYMGEDSVKPFLIYPEKWVILLALTSNKGSHDFQLTEDVNGERLFDYTRDPNKVTSNAPVLTQTDNKESRKPDIQEVEKQVPKVDAEIKAEQIPLGTPVPREITGANSI